MLAKLGATVDLTGCVTRLCDVVGGSPEALERRLGYREGHLRTGFQIALLKAPLARDDIVFFGYTAFSGGKAGRPSRDAAEEARRQPMRQDYFTDSAARTAFDTFFTTTGTRRVVKILDPDWDPAIDTVDRYPPGSGVPQWSIVKGRGKPFLVAAEVVGSAWTLAGSGARFDVALHNYSLPDEAQPARQVRLALEMM